MKKMLYILLVLLVLYGALSTLLYFFQEKIIFLPSKLPQNFTYSFNEPFEEIFLEASDGAQLNALHFESQAERDFKGVILYFHGNAGDLSRWGNIVEDLLPFGYDLFVMDYRGYGKSTGELSQEKLYSDALMCYEYLLKEYPTEHIVLYGRSLGTGLVAQLASKVDCQQVILETPYHSLEDMAKRRYPFMPYSLLLRYPMPSYQFLEQVDCPVMIFHGTKDRVVPYDSGKKLYDYLLEKNKANVTFVTIKGGTHHDLIAFPQFKKELGKILQGETPDIRNSK